METEITCDVCGLGIAYPVCFQLNPCSCRACVRCFHQLVPAKVFNRCPSSGCSGWITSSTLLEIEGTRDRPALLQKPSVDAGRDRDRRPPTDDGHDGDNDGGGGDDSASSKTVTDSGSETETPSRPHNSSLLREVQEVPHFQPDEQMDPFRHWAIEKPSLYTGFLYVAYRSSKSEATFYKSNFRAFDSSVFMDDNSTDEMVKIFARILHPLMFQRKGGDGGETSPSRIEDPDDAPPESCNGCHRRQDRQHLAMRCLYALSSGRVLTRAEQEEEFGVPSQARNHVDGPAAAGIRSRRATQHLARELLDTYRKSCLARKQERQDDPVPSSTTVSPLPPPPQVVHDLRCLSDDDSERQYPQREASISYHHHRRTEPRPIDEGITKQTAAGTGRSWENELGLNESRGDDDDDSDADASSPVVPAILWILSAVFILSK